jgi:adenosylhomocysteine nucleosidase
MREELAAVLDDIEGGERQQVAGREFWLGRLHGHDVVAVQAGIGKVAAATTAAVLIERYPVDALLFTGVAGGLAAGVRRGDVVVADAFLQHDMDASPLFPRHEVPLYGRARFATDPGWSARLAQAARQALPHAGLHRGLVISGDRFVANAADSLALRAALPEALAVEMEGAACAQVCLDYGLPYAAVRTISDRADDEAHGDFQQFIETTASRIVQALLS